MRPGARHRTVLRPSSTAVTADRGEGWVPMTDYGPAQYPPRHAPATPPPGHAPPTGYAQSPSTGRPAGNGQPTGYGAPGGERPPNGYGPTFERVHAPGLEQTQGYRPTDRCRRCQRDLVPHAVACAYCGERVPISGTPEARPIIVATGRRRRAGYFVCGGGGGIGISVLLPWVSVAGIASANLSGGGVVVLLALGAGLAYLGTRILKDRITKTTMIVLWVLAAIDLLLILILFAEVGRADGESGGLATPAAGFFIAVVGLIAATVGTIMVQTTRHGREAVAPVPVGAPYLSADRSAWWDGQAWRDAALQAPPGHPRSPDGKFWWDGYAWRPVLPS